MLGIDREVGIAEDDQLPLGDFHSGPNGTAFAAVRLELQHGSIGQRRSCQFRSSGCAVSRPIVDPEHFGFVEVDCAHGSGSSKSNEPRLNAGHLVEGGNDERQPRLG